MRVYKNCNLTVTVLLTICLFLYRKNLKKTKGSVWGVAMRTIKLMKFLYKKQNQRMEVQLMSHLFLHHKNLKETKDGIWGMMTRTMKSVKVCV